ncbi:hypothetical protein BJ170DRAFT_678075 [Xylariales sp. AK1849]|nr:hypothetical protein BJ170DRAFT_678075 [Xylariales sp. AK1849]
MNCKSCVPLLTLLSILGLVLGLPTNPEPHVTSRTRGPVEVTQLHPINDNSPDAKPSYTVVDDAQTRTPGFDGRLALPNHTPQANDTVTLNPARISGSYKGLEAEVSIHKGGGALDLDSEDHDPHSAPRSSPGIEEERDHAPAGKNGHRTSRLRQANPKFCQEQGDNIEYFYFDGREDRYQPDAPNTRLENEGFGDHSMNDDDSCRFEEDVDLDAANVSNRGDSPAISGDEAAARKFMRNLLTAEEIKVEIGIITVEAVHPFLPALASKVDALEVKTERQTNAILEKISETEIENKASRLVANPATGHPLRARLLGPTRASSPIGVSTPSADGRSASRGSSMDY